MYAAPDLIDLYMQAPLGLLAVSSEPDRERPSHEH